MKVHSHQYRQDLVAEILNELYSLWKGKEYNSKNLEIVIQKKLQEKTSFTIRTIKDYEEVIHPKLVQMLTSA